MQGLTANLKLCNKSTYQHYVYAVYLLRIGKLRTAMFFLFMLLDDDDCDKFTLLYRKYRIPLEHYALSLLHNKQLAEEATQETFIRVFRNLDKISENNCSKTWYYMVTISKNVCLTLIKKENKAASYQANELDIENIESYDEPAWSKFQAKELAQELREYAEKNLSKDELTILTLSSVHKMSYKEIASVVGISEGYVSVKLSRIRKKMKLHLSLEGAYE